MPVGTVALAVNPLDAHSLLSTFGTLGIFVAMFLETGLLVGFFLPGDSLLFTAGLLCATSASGSLHLSLPLVLVAAATGALLGAETGFVIGWVTGPRLLDRPDRPRMQHAVERSREVLERYGVAKAIVLARFIPLVRTVLNPLAGAVRVPLATFTVAQVLGGLAWSIGVTLAGYGLGSRIPSIDRYLLPIITVVVLVSVIPIALEWRRLRESRNRTAA